MQSLAAPLLLGSLWALVPGGVAPLWMIVRTVRKDRTLHQGLEEYHEHALQVRQRVRRGIW
jgi:protein-S-isoprenylcysteine O-methyltransferase Ste14